MNCKKSVKKRANWLERKRIFQLPQSKKRRGLGVISGVEGKEKTREHPRISGCVSRVFLGFPLEFQMKSDVTHHVSRRKSREYQEIFRKKGQKNKKKKVV